MRTVAVSELKASLSRFLARVKAGDEVVVTERGRPVARLVPMARATENIPAHLLDLQRRGLVKVGDSKLPKDFLTMRRPTDKGNAALRSLLEERKESR